MINPSEEAPCGGVLHERLRIFRSVLVDHIDDVQNVATFLDCVRHRDREVL